MKTKEQLIIEATDPTYLLRDQISGLSARQISGLSARQISWLSARQISWLSARQISWLSADQISRLSADQISRLSADQISGLSARQISWLSARQISWLSADQISGLSADQISWLKAKQKRFQIEKVYTKLLEAIKRPGCSLDMKTWHTCETTHCIGGWLVTIHPEGKKLEIELGDTGSAARAILLASRPDAPLPRFDGDAPEDAIMAFVEARAEEEK